MKKQELAILTPNAPLELQYSKETKIRHLDSGEEVLRLLNYLYVLLNIKKENQLNEIEESVLNGVIISNFGTYTIQEIKHAFRLAVSGKLEIEMYQKLDSVIFGKVMLTYQKHKQHIIKHFKNKNMAKKVKKPTQEELSKIDKEFYDNCVVSYFEEHKEMKQPKIDWSTFAVWKWLYAKTPIKLKEKEKESYRKEAKIYWLKNLKKKRSEGENISIDAVMGERTHGMYLGCIALFHKLKELHKAQEIEVKGINDKL
jgi:hypothetical protein